MEFSKKEVQLKIQAPALEKKVKSVAFTGHREIERYADFSARKLYEAAETYVKRGATDFYCGMARGFDLLAGECVLALKKIYPAIRLIAYIPYEKQYEKMNDEEAARYMHLKDCADAEKSKIFFGSYVRWCMTYRDDRLVEAADALIAFLRKNSGGTAYTVRKFLKKKGDEIIYI